MKTLPYFKWFPADAQTDAFFLSLSYEERGMYHTCLDLAWMNDGIPADPDELCGLLRLSRKQFDRLWARLSRKWAPSPRDPQKIVNPRQEEERESALSKSGNMKRNGNQNARRRNAEETQLRPNAFTRASVSVSDSVSESFLEGKRTALQKRNVVEHPGAPTQESDDRFEEIWQRWPRKTGKNAAAMDWVSVVTPANVAEVMACAERYLGSDEVARGAVKNLGSTPEKTGWLIDCARDNWESDWPKAVQQGKKSNFDLALEEMK